MKIDKRVSRTFTHPAVWGSILLLLLNDHLFKVWIPSWWTGKISDFAGLFFFPLLLIAVGRLLWPRLRRRPDLEKGVFACTALWFFLMKTSPLVNGWTSIMAGWLTGGPRQIILDPTDIMALIALWPAWQLWQKTGRPLPTAPLSSRRRPAGAVLLLAVVATLASSPPEYWQISRVFVVDETLYAVLGEAGFLILARQYDVAADEWVAMSQSDGEVEMPDEVVDQACVPAGSAEICYRITHPDDGFGRVEVSTDGGSTWEKEWQQYSSRHWMNRHRSHRGRAGFSPGPHDLAILPLAADEYIVAVAAGTEGVALRQPDGEWKSYIFSDIWPASEYYDSIMMPDFTVWYMLTVIVGLVLANRFWYFEKQTPTRAVLNPIIIIVGSLIFLLIVWVMSDSRIFWPVTIMLGLVFLSQYRRFRRTPLINRQLEHSPAAAGVWLITVSAIYLIGTVPLLLWALNGSFPYTFVWLPALVGLGLLLWWSLSRLQAWVEQPVDADSSDGEAAR